MITYAKNYKVPLLGICRGHQMLNVALGGSLHTDIPTDIENNILHRDKDNPPIHEISIDTASLLYEITGLNQCLVNSYHHQSADNIGEKLRENFCYRK